jgi:hypothetical protein
VNGQTINSSRSIKIFDPVTGEELASVSDTQKDGLDRPRFPPGRSLEISWFQISGRCHMNPNSASSTWRLNLEAVWGPTALQGLDSEQNVGIATTNGAIRLLHASYSLIPQLLENTELILRKACEDTRD